MVEVYLHAVPSATDYVVGRIAFLRQNNKIVEVLAAGSYVYHTTDITYAYLCGVADALEDFGPPIRYYKTHGTCIYVPVGSLHEDVKRFSMHEYLIGLFNYPNLSEEYREVAERIDKLLHHGYTASLQIFDDKSNEHFVDAGELASDNIDLHDLVDWYQITNNIDKDKRW